MRCVRHNMYMQCIRSLFSPHAVHLDRRGQLFAVCHFYCDEDEVYDHPAVGRDTMEGELRVDETVKHGTKGYKAIWVYGCVAVWV